MRVIDLLNKIANGEEVPRKFRFAGQIFEKQGSYIEDEDGDSIFDSMFYDFSNLNDEIEIIEDKKIEKLENKIDTTFENYNYSERRRLTEMVNKINEIIDYLNKEEE